MHIEKNQGKGYLFLLCGPLQPGSSVVVNPNQHELGHVQMHKTVYILFGAKSVPLCDVCSRGTSHAAPAVKHEVVLSRRLLETKLLGEQRRGKAERVAENRERDVDSTRNHALQDFLSFPNVDNVSVLEDLLSGL
jgi:hypothetical protein